MKSKYLIYLAIIISFLSFFVFLFLTFKKVAEQEIKEEKVKVTEFQRFIQIIWPFHIENECGCDKNFQICKEIKCCNFIKGDLGKFTCFGVAKNYNSSFFQLISLLEKKEKFLVIEKYAQLQLYSKCFTNINVDKLNFYWKFPVFDYCIHSGSNKAIKALQKILNVNQDGIIGKLTIRSSFLFKNYQDYNKLRAYNLRYNSSQYKKFRKGFELRIQRFKRQSDLVVELYKKSISSSSISSF